MAIDTIINGIKVDNGADNGKLPVYNSTSKDFVMTSPSSGSGDTIAPATNTDNYIPQWNGANSKTLKDGIPTSTFAPALGTDDNYVTDAEKIVIGNTSGTNTGDNSANSLYSGLASSKLDANVAITGGTKTKITYDTKGLVTSGSDATTADIADSLDKRYVTDANLTTIGNQSGTNTGDNAVNSNYSGLVSNATHTGDATGATALTVVKIQGKDFPTLGVGDDQKYPKYNNATNAFVMSTVTATAPNITLNLLAPTGDETITAGYSAYVVDYYEVASTYMLEVGDGAVFEIG